MTLKLLLVIFLMALDFDCIQNESHSLSSFFLYPSMKSRMELKDIKSTFSSGAVTVTGPEEESTKATNQMESVEEKLESNRRKREAGLEVVSVATEIHKSLPKSKNLEQSQVQVEEISKPISPLKTDKTKRQTTIKGNGNRLSNLINLPARLNVLANVLSQLNQGVIDTKEKSPSGNSISGNDNTVSSLVNAPVNVDAVVNLLGSVDRLNPDSTAAAAAGSDGIVGKLFGVLVGGGKRDSGKGDKGLVDGLLGGILGEGDSSGILGDVLGDTLDDLLAALLGSNGLVGNLLGGLDGKSLVTELLEGLLDGVTDLVDSLLNLLVGILESLSHGLGNTNVNAPPAAVDHDGIKAIIQATGAQTVDVEGNNNTISSLINIPLRVSALINALTSLKQEIRQQVDPAVSNQDFRIQGNNNKVSSLVNIPAHVDVKANLLSSVVENSLDKVGNSVPPMSSPSETSLSDSSATKSSFSADTDSTSIEGNNNILSSLLNVVPDVNLNLNLLSEITDLLGDGGDGTNENGKNISENIHIGNNPNEICFDIPMQTADTSITGDNNKISNAINIKPKINIDLNLLSTVKQTSDSSVPTQRVCITRATQPSRNSTPTGSTPETPQQAPTKPSPARPTPSNPALPTPRTPKLITSLPVPPTPTPASLASPTEKCFDVLVDQSGVVIGGHNNHISSLINLEPKIDLDLNLLANIQQPQPQPGLMVKRICVPAVTMPPITPIQVPFTEKPSLPVRPRANSRCFRRTCIKWRQFVDYNCVNQPNEYPKITYTMDV